MLRHDSFVKGLRVLELTCPTPALPYISAITINSETMYAAIDEAIDSMPLPLKQVIGIKQLVWIEPAEYLNVNNA